MTTLERESWGSTSPYCRKDGGNPTQVVWTCRENICTLCVVRRIDHTEGRQITRGRGRPRITNRETIWKDLEINELDGDMIYDRTLSCHLINVAEADST